MKKDVSNRNEASGSARNENSGWTDSAINPKYQEKYLPDPSDSQENDANFWIEILPMKKMHNILQKGG